MPPPESDLNGPIRSAEGHALHTAKQRVVDAVSEQHHGQGELLREVAHNTARLNVLTGDMHDMRALLEKRIESMRPKLDSIPAIVDDRIEDEFTQRELRRLRESKAERKTLQFEVYKAVIAVLVAGALGAVSTCAWQSVVYATGHAQRASSAAAQPPVTRPSGAQ